LVLGDALVSARRSARVVGVAVLVGAAALVAGLTLLVLGRAAGHGGGVLSLGDFLQEVLPGLGFLAVGAVVSVRRRENPIGWLCLALGLAAVLIWLGEQYATYALVTHPRVLPGGLALAIVTNGGFAPTLLLLLLVVSLFPDGRLPSPRWRALPIAAVAACAALYAFSATQTFGTTYGKAHNPLAARHHDPLLVVVLGLSVVLAIASVVGSFAAVGVRFRRSEGQERAQIKWLAFVASFLPLLIVAHSIGDTWAPQAVGTIEAVFSVVFVALPVAIGVAILRYRLYEIDKLISRTISYALLTATLGGVFVGGVVFLTDVLPFSSPVAVAASTLVAAALFTPLRARLQRLIDRRFNRSRYDAEAIVAAFTGQLRESIDLDSISNTLMAVVAQSVEPTHAFIWVRPNTLRPAPDA
jgi:hypothetical protein